MKKSTNRGEKEKKSTKTIKKEGKAASDVPERWEGI